MRIAVQKFGGSSLKEARQREMVGTRIIETRNSGYAVVVVVSAMGRAGDPYATDTLIHLIEREFPQVDPREKDLIMSCGEILSSIVLAAILNARGEKAVALTGFQAGIRTNRDFGSARITSIDSSRILKLLEEEYIVIVSGFQGITDDLEITTLGRGGSDTTATALGAALGAEIVEIFTDVDGVMTIDPRVYEGAKIISELTYQEMGEMSNEGAKVLHSRCVELSREYGTPLWVKGAFSADAGTCIHSPEEPGCHARIVTGLIHRTGLHEFMLDLSGKGQDVTLRRRLFETLAGEGISLDLINLLYDSLYFVVDEKVSDKVSRRLEGLQIPFESRQGMAKISCVGQGMKGTPGVMARIYEALSSRRIKVHRSVDSYINISCLIAEEDLIPAVEVLHEKFSLGGEPPAGT